MPTGTVAIIGAGSVGASTAFTLVLRGLARRILLVDIKHEKARGEALDLEHCAALVPAVEIHAVGLDEIGGSDVVIVTAGAKQKPGQTRLDLAGANIAMLRGVLPRVLDVAPEAWLVIVTNPVDVLTYAALRFTGLPPAQVIGSGTVLDTARLRSLVARRINVSPMNVHAYIVGEHGDSEIALWSGVKVGGVPLDAFEFNGRAIDARVREELLEETRRAAGKIVAAKGATNWAIAVATARILEAHLRDENAILTVSRLVEDYYGIRDVCLSAPSLVSRAGVGPALPVDLTPAELAGLRRSAETIGGVLDRFGLRQAAPAFA